MKIAEQIARQAHAEQKDTVTGVPYITHVERVVGIVRSHTIGWHQQDEAIAVAWLHDVVEDSPFTIRDLCRAGISDDVLDAVERLTRQATYNYSDYIDEIRVCGPQLARVVKIADLMDHLQPNCPERLRPRYERALQALGAVSPLADEPTQPPPFAVRDGWQERAQELETLLAAGEARAAALHREMEELDFGKKYAVAGWDAEQDRRVEAEAAIVSLQAERDELQAVLLAIHSTKPIDSPDHCQGCGGVYRFDTSVPSVVWNAVIRARGLPEYLCLSCVAREFVKRGESFTAELYGAGFHGDPIEVRVNGIVAQDVVKVNDENNVLRVQLHDLQAQLQAITQEMRVRLANHTDGDIAIHVSIVRGWLEALTK